MVQWIEFQTWSWEDQGSDVASDTSQLGDPGQVTQPPLPGPYCSSALEPMHSIDSEMEGKQGLFFRNTSISMILRKSF